MKIEIDVAEDDIRSAVSVMIRARLAEHLNKSNTANHIRNRIAELWHSEVDKIILEEVAGSSALQGKIKNEIEKKLRNKINAIMNKI